MSCAPAAILLCALLPGAAAAVLARPAAGETPPAVRTEEASRLFPPPGVVPGWAPAEAPEHFRAEDLWRHIDGAADQYLSFGCASLDAAYYREEGTGSEIAIEIYRTEDELGSFGLYALERPEAGPRLAVAAQGYQVGGDLAIYGGCYYVKLRAYPDDEARRAAALRLAEWIASNKLAGSAPPAQLEAFPADSLVVDSFGLVPRGALGLSGLGRALTADYRGKNGEFTLYWARQADADSARAAFSKLRSTFSRRSLSPPRPAGIRGADSVVGEMKHQGLVMMGRRGRDIVLAAGADDPDWMKRVIETLFENLP